jgi:hypothetical protein
MEGFASKVNQAGAVLADGIQQDGLAELRGRLAQDVDRLGFESTQVSESWVLHLRSRQERCYSIYPISSKNM